MTNAIKDLLQVTKYAANRFLLFSASSISLIKLNLAFVVDDFDLKQNCLFTNMMYI
jgi:hypothetical protein